MRNISIQEIWLLIKTIPLMILGIVLYACYIPYGFIRTFVDLKQFGEFLQFVSDWTLHFRDKVFDR